MPEDSLSPSELTLHIVVGTVPQQQEKLFDEKITTEYYEKFRKNSMEFCLQSDKEEYLYSGNDTTHSTPALYNPIKYYILGNYDIAYISLIDNLKFAQRLFESSPGDADDTFSPHTFQSFTGITFGPKEKLKDFFYEHLNPSPGKGKYFLGICNLKLNNGFLIGNGNTFKDPVMRKIKAVIDAFNDDVNRKADDKVEFLLQQSFSWFEFSLLLFTNNTESIAEVLTTLRGLSVNSLDDNKKIVEESLYRQVDQQATIEELSKANVFADTHTYIGIHAHLINKQNIDSAFTQDFLSRASELKLLTEVEWQVKPGHMHLLVDLLEKELGKTESGFELKNRFLLTGKTDYLLQEKSDSVYTNYKLMQLLFDDKGELFNHIRKIRTRVMFKGPAKRSIDGERKSFALSPVLKKLAIPGTAIKEVEKNLKALKISRLIKSKIIKIFSNFNNGIQDVILFPFFLDFKIFIDELVKMINREYSDWKNATTMKGDDFFNKSYASYQGNETGEEPDIHSVNELEKLLIKRIIVFEEAYNLRMHNCYQFEDITDFDLDFNGSVQQLLSAYSSLITEMGNIFYEGNKKYQLGPVIQLNLTDTQANYSSINYHVHYLVSPEFVFATATKEILNNEDYDAQPVKELRIKYKEALPSLEFEHPELYDLIKKGFFDFSYFVNDAVRFAITYDFDYKLFYYWFWMYNLQNPLLYDKRGMMNENHFIKELFRILLVAKYFNVDAKDLKCPIEELYTYWDRHYNAVDKYTDQYKKFLFDKGLLSKVQEYLGARLINFLRVVIPGDQSYDKTIRAKENAKLLMGLLDSYEVQIPFDKYFIMHDKIRQCNEGALATMTGSEPFDIHYFMKRYLQSIYDKNEGVISYLRRDWETGRPLSCFIQANDQQHMYSVDQTGGLFFDNMSQLNTYMKQSCEVINHLLHISMVRKKNFILYKKKNTHEYRTPR